MVIRPSDSEVRSELITTRYVKAGQEKYPVFEASLTYRWMLREGDFFLSIEKRKSIILGLQSSLNIHLSERQQKWVRMKKGMVGIIRLV